MYNVNNSYKEDLMVKEDVISILKENSGSYVSGQYLSIRLNVSRTAIWKYIKSLKESGYIIESSSKKGYRIISSPDLLTSDEIKPYLYTKYLGHEIIHFDTLDSTNNKAKEIASKVGSNGTVITSEEQVAGKGRLGRQWVSPKYKGIWMSFILKPDMEPIQVPKITHIAAAAVVTALNKFNINAFIKWPNDIIVKGKKICGILTEMSGEINCTDYVIIGIGINANLETLDIPMDIIHKASSLLIESGRFIERKILAAEVINSFEQLYEKFLNSGSIEDSIEICRKSSILLGKEIRIINRQLEETAKAIDISNDGELIAEFADGTKRTIISGEVSIRGLNGYI